MLLPFHLQKGDTVAIISPSNPILSERRQLYELAARKFETLGLKTIFSKNCFGVDKYGVSAGSAQERADDLNEMFRKPEVKAIYCALGGSTAIELLHLIDFELIQKHPKLFLGMSDIDVLHLAIHQKTGLVVFHASNPQAGAGANFDDSFTWQNFQDRLMLRSDKVKAYQERICVRKGRAEGKLLGCNLSSMLRLAGTEYFPDFENAILFLEGFSEKMQTAIPKLRQLKEIGVFDKIKGLVIGHVYGFQDENWIKRNNITAKYEDLVAELTAEYDFPILKTNDFGHHGVGSFLPIGAQVMMDTERKEIKLVGEFML